MKAKAEIISKHSCKECDKIFVSELELKIHVKFKHPTGVQMKNENINSSDISDQEEESIKRCREQYKRRMENSCANIQNRSDDKDAIETDEASNPSKMTDLTIKNNLLGRFFDPTLQANAFKKIYLCGCSHRVFQSSELLTLHTSKQHNGFPPEGTLYGVWRELVLRQFQPIEEKMPIMRPFIEKTSFVCGCGLSYARVSSLKHHIRKNHEGAVPLGTIGLPKDSLELKEPSILDVSENQAEAVSDSRSNIDLLEISQRCMLCQDLCIQSYWTCDACQRWRICGDCLESGKSIKKHQLQGHEVRKIQIS